MIDAEAQLEDTATDSTLFNFGEKLSGTDPAIALHGTSYWLGYVVRRPSIELG